MWSTTFKMEEMREREREARHIDRTIGNGCWTCLFLIVVFANVDSMYRKRWLQ